METAGAVDFARIQVQMQQRHENEGILLNAAEASALTLSTSLTGAQQLW